MEYRTLPHGGEKNVGLSSHTPGVVTMLPGIRGKAEISDSKVAFSFCNGVEKAAFYYGKKPWILVKYDAWMLGAKNNDSTGKIIHKITYDK